MDFYKVPYDKGYGDRLGSSPSFESILRGELLKLVAEAKREQQLKSEKQGENNAGLQ